jgi:hypothetical protein
MKTKGIAGKTAVAALTVLALSTQALAEDLRAGVVRIVQGTVMVARSTEARPLPLKFDDDVLWGDRLTTGGQSLAKILLGTFATVTVCERSMLTLTRKADGAASVLTLNIGRIHLDVVKARMEPGWSVKMKTPDAVVDVPDAIVIAEVPDGMAGGGTKSRFRVVHGYVDVTWLDPATGRPDAAPFSFFPPDDKSSVTMASPPRPPSQLTTSADVCSVAILALP